MGASRVVVAGGNQQALNDLADAGGKRVASVALSGDVARDSSALREAAGGGAHIAFDMVGSARDANSTLAAPAGASPFRTIGPLSNSAKDFSAVRPH